MATPQLSPGVLVREVDLTVGRADNVLDNIGAIAGPFAIGPVEEPIDITTEQELINVFGKPLSTDAQYEYWMSASSFLSYGGVLKVVRTDGEYLRNANAGVNKANSDELKIKNFDDYEANYADDIADYVFAAKNPGSWANNLKVCVIDDYADQIIGIATTNPGALNITVGAAVTASLDGKVVAGAGATSNFTGYLKGVVTGVNTDALNGNSTIDVKIVSRVSVDTNQFNVVKSTNASRFIGVGSTGIWVDSVDGVTTSDFVLFPGITTPTAVVQVDSVNKIAYVGTASSTSLAIVDGATVEFSRQVSIAGTETSISYADKSDTQSFTRSQDLTFRTTGGANIGIVTATGVTAVSVEDWYNEQRLELDNLVIYWSSLAPKPLTNGYVAERGGKNDAVHVVVVDDTGDVTGIQGNLLEKHLNLSKASDAVSQVNAPQRIFWKEYVARFSEYLYVGDNPGTGSDTYNGTYPRATGFEGLGGSDQWNLIDEGEGGWNLPAQNKVFNVIGNVTYTLKGGIDYSASGGMKSTLGDIITGYNLFSNRDEIPVDYLIMGPGFSGDEFVPFDSQAKASHLISIANQRKDCIAVISPHRGSVVDITNTDRQTDNIIRFFSSLPSSSYAIFDSGYKYTYDRFNNKFRYIPCNADVAGLCVRTSIFAYPWFSPAGQQRGILNNAIKLAYNPNKAQRDQLYPQRINAIINKPGIGIHLFGDKTALGYASAFDRINVRRLFLTVEQALEQTAVSQLFELNDEITRSNFINIVEPYLRDVQAKRGLYGFLVVCDETNNTPDVIDNNEFRADIFLKPAKSINYVTLTFVATRTGVSFEEVVGRV